MVGRGFPLKYVLCIAQFVDSITINSAWEWVYWSLVWTVTRKQFPMAKQTEYWQTDYKSITTLQTTAWKKDLPWLPSWKQREQFLQNPQNSIHQFNIWKCVSACIWKYLVNPEEKGSRNVSNEREQEWYLIIKMTNISVYH